MSVNEGARSVEAERAYLRYLARLSAGEPASFEELCAQHRELADELRELNAAIEGAISTGALSDRLAQRFGAQVDPEITLGGADEPAGSAPADRISSEVLDALSRRRGSFSRYELKGEIDRGGQGAVVRVWDAELRRTLAMKVLLGRTGPGPSHATPPVDPRSLGRFLEEAQVTGQLDHPGIVPVHELGLDSEGRVYFTMKLVKGQTFKSVLELLAEGKEGWTQTRALGVLLRVCEAMSYAHHKGVVHRDLKPANVMVGRFGEVYVMDWGLAKVLGRPDSKNVAIDPRAATGELRSEMHERRQAAADSPLLTMDGDVVGTPAYMPPEQALGRTDDIGPRSDIYSLGAILYHLLAGHMPYVKPGMRLSNYAVWYRVQEGPPDAIAQRAPLAAPELLAICGRAMAREADARYRDMGAFAADLSAYLEGRVVSAYEAGAWAEARKWVLRNKALASSLAAALVLLIAGLATSLVFRALAEESAQVADRRAEEAAERAEEVLRLSALQDLEDLPARADALWPAHPENIALFESWIGEGRELVGRLPDHRALCAELRSRALPRTEAEREAERRSHPRHPDLERAEKERAWKRAAWLRRSDGIEAELPAPDWGSYPSDPSSLNDAAWLRVDPDRARSEHSSEAALGVALASRALELAESDGDRTTFGTTLAWAYFAVGRDDDALNTGYQVLEEASEGRKSGARTQLGLLEQAIARATSTAGLARTVEELEALDARCAELSALVSELRDWRFAEEEREAHWWSNQLAELTRGLEELDRRLLAPDAVTPEHGWSVPRRLAFAQELRAGFAPGGAYALAWERSLPAIGATYPSLELSPQMGLVPIGPDPDSGLWEFAHLQTGVPAVRAESGELFLTEETGLVFVLIPAGTFWMGAQRNRSRQNYDPDARIDEAPVHEIELSAFFLSKYEMTQGQWATLSGDDPSRLGKAYLVPSWDGSSPGWTARLPVEGVTWTDCQSLMQRLALSLPTEAQWERACRAGTATAFASSSPSEPLSSIAHLWAPESGPLPLDADGTPVQGPFRHAAVGSQSSNAFGLHDVHGNVAEWCLDGYDAEFYALSPSKDPVAPWAGSASRVSRGGSFLAIRSSARSAARTEIVPSHADAGTGLRPARVIDP